ncbi:MAG: response regulator [Lachnospiraceae bacterium]|nr:response regulator [Lachnospiraceae bacterium]
MYSIVIADDESIARKSLELFLKKEFPDIQIIASVQDGIQLMEVVEKQEPDIAIVDINMPGISGIDAIELMNQKSIQTKFIINTAYSDFEYVKKALDMKVEGYLMKPWKHEESVETIRKVCVLIDREKSEIVEKNRIKSLLYTVAPVLKSEILLSIMTNKPKVDDFNAYCEVNNIVFSGGCIATLIDRKSTKRNRTETESCINRVLEAFCSYLVSFTETSISIFIFIPGQIVEEEKERWVLDVIDLVVQHLKLETGIEYRIGIGSIYSEIDKMPFSYKESMDALKENANMYSDDKMVENEGKSSIYIERASMYISKHYMEDISLASVAEHIRISPYYLSRLMKQTEGITFIEYLTEIRMKEAMRLAWETELPIKDIAVKCGYANDTYFCKVFKRQTGKTIGEYRRDI